MQTEGTLLVLEILHTHTLDVHIFAVAAEQQEQKE